MRACLDVSVAGTVLETDVTVPPEPLGVVLFAHGPGSGRLSERDRYVARILHQAGLATVLVDLFTRAETRAVRHGGATQQPLGEQAARLTALVDWLAGYHPTVGLRIGLFGASTGTAAALRVAGARPPATSSTPGVAAVVSRGGRPDLAMDILQSVHQPTLLIVGEHDGTVVTLNEQASATLAGHTRIDTVHGASHLFTEPGALARVAELSRDWFLRYLPAATATALLAATAAARPAVTDAVGSLASVSGNTMPEPMGS